MQEASPAHEGVTPPRRMSALDNAKWFSLDFVFINLSQHLLQTYIALVECQHSFLKGFSANICVGYLSLVKLLCYVSQ